MNEEELANQALASPSALERKMLPPATSETPRFRKYLDPSFARRLIEHMHRAKQKALLEKE